MLSRRSAISCAVALGAAFAGPRAALAGLSMLPFDPSARFGWYPWMHMGDVEGDLIWHSSGRKIEHASDLPQAFVDECESLWPNSILAPDRAIRGNARKK